MTKTGDKQSHGKSIQVAGMNFEGGVHGKFFFCILEHYTHEDRWFLRTLDYDSYSDPEGPGLLELTNPLHHLKQNDFKHIVVDFPLSTPVCRTCEIGCPGQSRCPHKDIQDARTFIDGILEKDRKRYDLDPKQYERDRQAGNCGILSKSFKRRLRKGILPYWNRPLDIWIWSQYHDSLMDFFSYSFDSFKDTSLMNLFHFEYLKKHLPSNIHFHETNPYLVLIELFNAHVFSRKTMNEFKSFESAAHARMNTLEAIEKKLDIFIYEKDFDILVRNPRAFKSFLLSLCSRQLALRSSRYPFDDRHSPFIVPVF